MLSRCPKMLVPGGFALVHGTFGHPGVARTTRFIRRKYGTTDPFSSRAQGELSLYCACCRRKTAWSPPLAMLRARL